MLLQHVLYCNDTKFLKTLGFTVKRVMEERRLILAEGKENTNINSVSVSAISTH